MSNLTVWFCTLCRDDVQIGAKPAVCCYCGNAENLNATQLPYIPDTTKPLHAEPFG